ncbi:MAG: 4-oxalocrotonate tautomerase family protein [Myxococcota bacterium]|nr:4-oxalocrotonate tautomerase family protein [Myxococcota bacterium]
MPMITVAIAAEPDDRLAREVAEKASALTAQWLGKDPNVTAVAVEFIAPKHWFIAGRSLEERRKRAFFMDVRISDGTNNKGEKAAFIGAAFDAMARLLGGVDEESYVHVDDVRADAYGYGGLTQERRYVESLRLPPANFA